MRNYRAEADILVLRTQRHCRDINRSRDWILPFALCVLLHLNTFLPPAHAQQDAQSIEPPTISVEAQLVEDFDGVQPAWHIDEKRSQALTTIRVQRRDDRSPYRGRRCEYISLLGNRGGEEILATHTMPHFSAIEELNIGLWLRGNRRDFQLMARVRLPRERDKDGEPLQLHVYGDSYSTVGFWQHLQITNFDANVASVVRALQIEHGRHIDSAEAYVDQVVVNMYGGAGLNRVWIDDLTVSAGVLVDNERNSKQKNHVALANYQQDLGTRSHMLMGRQSLHSSSFLPRVVTHRGEPFELLKELGFNTVWLEQSPSHEQLDAASKAKLRIVCPPPINLQSLAAPGGDFPEVVGWVLDGRYATPQNTKARSRAIRAADPRKRPLLAFSVGGQVGWSNVADIVMRQKPAPDEARDGDWVALGGPLVSTSRWWSLRDQVWNGVINGNRGFVLITGQRLHDPSDRHARNLAELFNTELNVLRPWILAPHIDRNIVFSKSGQTPRHPFRAETLSDDHAGIVFIRREENGSRGPRRNEIEIPMGAHREVFRVEPGGLSPHLANRRIAGGLRITLDAAKPDGLFLLTDRKPIVERMARHLQSIGEKTNRTLVEVLRQELILLDNRLEHTVSDAGLRAHLRREVHALHGRIAPLLATDGTHEANFRELDHVLGQLQRVHESISK